MSHAQTLESLQKIQLQHVFSILLLHIISPATGTHPKRVSHFTHRKISLTGSHFAPDVHMELEYLAKPDFLIRLERLLYGQVFHCPLNYTTDIIHMLCKGRRNYMSLSVRKPTIWVPTGSDTNQAVQSQKMDRGWKFQI